MSLENTLQDTSSSTFLDVWHDSNYAYVYVSVNLACKVILGSASGMFRHNQTLFKSIFRTLCILAIFLSQSIFRLYGIFIIPYQTFSQKLNLGRLVQF